MGRNTDHKPVLLIAAVTSQFSGAIDWAANECSSIWGPIAFKSEDFVFDQTKYYDEEMGNDLRKCFFVFEQLIDPPQVVKAKLASNQLESKLADTKDWGVSRPINIDPGYISEAKLVLATTKDRDHRLYLDLGIFAEITLFFRTGKWQSSRWTYPDFQQQEYHDFFDKCREHLRMRMRTE